MFVNLTQDTFYLSIKDQKHKNMGEAYGATIHTPKFIPSPLSLTHSFLPFTVVEREQVE
jgi:hypothetical protein